MRNGTLSLLRTLALAAFAVVAAISCPSPIDESLLLIVDDETAPLITIGSPAHNSLYRYSVGVTGILRDFSGATGSDEGFVRSLAFSVTGHPLLARTVTFARDGSFRVDPPDPTFTYASASGAFFFTVDTEGLMGPSYFTFIVEDLNGNIAQQTVTLLQDPVGPKLTVTAPLNGSSWTLLLPVSGRAVNEAGAATGDRIAKLTASVASFEHVLDIQLLELQGDGKYHGTAGTAAENFWFEPASGSFGDSFDLSSASGNLQLMVEVEDARGMATTTFLSLFDNNTGPEIILNDASHPCPPIYSSAVTTSIPMLGWVDPVNLKPGTTRYIVESTSWQRDAVYLVDGIDLDPLTGDFGFTFNPREAPTLSGRLTVHVYAQDNAGRITHATHNIYDDAVSPTGSFTVASDATYTTSTASSLTFAISDGSSGMSQMRFMNDGGLWSGWEPYDGAARAWTLTASDGAHTVYAEFSDKAGNVMAIHDAIILDSVPPSVSSFHLDGGADYTTDTTVSLGIAATDALSGMYRMRFSNNGVTWSAWEVYGTSATWTLTDADGTRTVHAEFSDHAGNVRSASDTIVLDRAGPSVSTFGINGGDAWTGSKSVTLTIAAVDAASGLGEMRLRNDGETWGSWGGYSASKGWQLANADGTRTVYLEIRDNVGNVSSASDSIGLDTTNPSISTFEINGGDATTTSLSVTLTITAADTPVGPYQMQFSNDGGSTWSGWQTYAGSASMSLGGDPTASGTRTIQVRVNDQAGHADSASDSISYEYTPPP